MEGHRLPILADGPHDDLATYTSRSVAENYEWSRDQKGDGELAATQAWRRYAWYEWNDIQILRWWNYTNTQTINKLRKYWWQSQEKELNIKLFSICVVAWIKLSNLWK